MAAGPQKSAFVHPETGLGERGHFRGAQMSAAARELRAMGASDAEIKAVLPAFGRHGVDVAKAWK